MGKLHTLRRAILRDPKKWRGARGASRTRKGEWYPSASYFTGTSYRSFIKHVVGPWQIRVTSDGVGMFR